MEILGHLYDFPDIFPYIGDSACWVGGLNTQSDVLRKPLEYLLSSLNLSSLINILGVPQNAALMGRFNWGQSTAPAPRAIITLLVENKVSFWLYG